MKKIGLDVDGVLANFIKGTVQRAAHLGLDKEYIKCCHEAPHWNIAPVFPQIMREAWNDPKFWLKLEPMEDVLPLPFQPYVYITSRRIDSSVTKEWLDKNGFPEAEVITVDNPTKKKAFIEDLKLDLFVDDYYPTVTELLAAGLPAVLYKAPYQRGHFIECKDLPTITTLKEVVNYV